MAAHGAIQKKQCWGFWAGVVVESQYYTIVHTGARQTQADMLALMLLWGSSMF